MASDRKAFLDGLADEVAAVLRQARLPLDSVRALTASVLRNVVRRFGGMQVYVARREPGAGSPARRAIELRAQGHSVADIAREMDLSERWVRHLLQQGETSAGKQEH